MSDNDNAFDLRNVTHLNNRLTLRLSDVDLKMIESIGKTMRRFSPSSSEVVRECIQKRYETLSNMGKIV